MTEPRLPDFPVTSAADAMGIDAAASLTVAHRARRRITFAHWVIAVLLVGLAVRLVVIAATPHFTPTDDAADYDRHAVSIAVHGVYPPSGFGGPSAFRPPLFPVVLAGVYKVAGVDPPSARWRAGRVAEALLGVLAVALICLIALRLWGRAVALLSAAIAAVFPPLILVGSSLMSESLYIPLVLTAVLTALVHRNSAHRWRYAVLTGVLVGLVALTRGNGIALLVPVLLLVWSERPRRSWRALRSPLVVVAAAVLTLIPWTVRNEVQFHAFIPVSTEAGSALRGAYNGISRADPRFPGLWRPPFDEMLRIHAANPHLNEAQVYDRLREEGLDYIGAHPGYFFEELLWNTERLLNLPGPGLERYFAPYEDYDATLAVVSVYAFWLLLALAAAGAATRAARRPPPAFWICPVALALPAIFFLGATRYRSPTDPFLVMLAALGLLAVARRPRPPPQPVPTT
jgi:4-amino-4-deoxy-L-arabinose transferase-like glycosyltransferase